MAEMLRSSSVGLIIRQKEPNNLETPFDQIDSFLTPTELFYIRSHFPSPKLELASYQLHVNPNRLTKALHRAPGAGEWEVWELDRAMDRIAELTKKARDETFIERTPDGKLVNQSLGVFSLGGATIDNEWNHIQQKLMRGLGIVAIENQARI